jgi:aspartyl-tRNA(Asn)/glutamyl-tRNA(Gln) amidotransferase subunit A
LPFYGSLENIQAEIQHGNLSCVSLVRHYLTNINNNKDLNAFIEVFKDEALAKAEDIDNKIAAKTNGKLAGLVVGIKDLLCYKDHQVNAASKMLVGFRSLYTATAVQRLIDEDAIIIGRQNCDEFGMGSSSETSIYGPVRNGASASHVAGGSSGGSAVAVQMDMCTVSLGTDTGGSVRQPAAFCGVIGLKPTYSRISRYGLTAYASSFDTIGIFSNFIDDNEKVLAIIAGKDEKDSTSSSNDYQLAKDESSLPKKICYYEELLSSGVDIEVADAFNKLIDKLRSEGHTVEPVSFPWQDFALPAYYLLTMAEASSNLSRYDGTRYGHRANNSSSFNELYAQGRSEGFGQEVKRRILLGTFILSTGYYDAYVAKAQKVRSLIREYTINLLNEYDFLLSPTTPATAFEIGIKREIPVEMYLEDLFTVQASLAGIPAISIPFKEKINNFPIGLQISANEFEENSLYRIAKDIINL